MRLNSETEEARKLRIENGGGLAEDIPFLLLAYERLKEENASLDGKLTFNENGYRHVHNLWQLEQNRADAAEAALASLRAAVRAWKRTYSEQDIVVDGYRRYREATDRLHALVGAEPSAQPDPKEQP